MASYSGFIRKSPTGRLRAFFAARGVEAPDGFNWDSQGPGTQLVQSIDALIGDLPALKQERLKAELDHLASLANQNGMQSAEQICTGAGVDLEGFEGVQDVLLMLAIDHPETYERVAVHASFTRRTGGKSWSSFQFDDGGKSWALDDDAARAGFLQDAIAILDLPDHRKREADWYTSIRVHPITGEETEIVQATIYVQDRAESELAFDNDSGLQRQVVQRVAEVGLACDATNQILEICAKGGKKTRDQYAQSFAKHFAPQSAPPIEAPRRDVLLDRLRSTPDFDIEPADGIERVEISSLEFYATGGGFARFEKRGDDGNIYQFLGQKFGGMSPLSASGWKIIGTTMRIILAPQEGKRRKTLTVTLRTPNTTTVPNKTEKELQFVMNLLERWGLIASPRQDFDVIEAE